MSIEFDLTALQGELARPAFHECNNFLNNCLLQFALIEESLSESIRRFSFTRGTRKQLARLIGAWQSFRKQKPPEKIAIDVREMLKQSPTKSRRTCRFPNRRLF
jgi:hypothetical protein